MQWLKSKLIAAAILLGVIAYALLRIFTLGKKSGRQQVMHSVQDASNSAQQKSDVATQQAQAQAPVAKDPDPVKRDDFTDTTF